MPQQGAIQFAQRRSDRLDVPQLVSIAAAGLSLGLGLMFALREATAPIPTETQVSAITSTPALAERARAVAQPALAGGPAEGAVRRAVLKTGGAAPKKDSVAVGKSASALVPAASTATSMSASTAAPVAAAASVKNAVAPQPVAVASSPLDTRKSGPHAFERGLTVYWRCDGLERKQSRFPCPRDRRFEDDVWKTLQQVRLCRDADPGRGHAELRVTLHRRAASEIEFQPPAKGRSLNLPAVSKCAAVDLARIHSRLRTPNAVVTFGFTLK